MLSQSRTSSSHDVVVSDRDPLMDVILTKGTEVIADALFTFEQVTLESLARTNATELPEVPFPIASIVFGVPAETRSRSNSLMDNLPSDVVERKEMIEKHARILKSLGSTLLSKADPYVDVSVLVDPGSPKAAARGG